MLVLAGTLLGCTSTPPTDYDVVIVGSGAGGAPLAARLAREGQRVLLLEAGQDVANKLEYRVPVMHAHSTEDHEMAWWYFVEHHADPAIDRADSKYTPEGILYPRGSALGGSTAVNAMVTVLPSASDWNRLAEVTSDARYRADRMNGLYDRVREWLPVSFPDPEVAAGDRQIVDFVLGAVEEVSGEPVSDGVFRNGSPAAVASALTRLLGGDVNRAFLAGEPEGVFRLPMAVEDGERRGTREHVMATVRDGHPLEVRLGAFVTRVLWDRTVDPPRAIGVEYLEGTGLYGASLGPAAEPGRTVQVQATEVVLAAGVFNTPQLLALSGVGDPEELDALGIDVVVESPGVGHNLQDRYEAAVVFELGQELSSVVRCELGEPVDPCLDEWHAGEGIYRTNGFAATALVRSSPELPQANLQVFAFPAEARGYYPGYSGDALARKDRFSWLILEGHTANADGVVSLVSADPLQRPRIRFNSYDETDPLADPDLLAMVDGIRLVRRIAEATRRRDPSTSIEEIWPGDELADERSLAEFVRRESWGHHACCTSPMGMAGDGRAVVDSRFRVIGADGLRVVDASVWPEIPGTFIALPTFMLSEAAAEVMLEDAQ